MNNKTLVYFSKEIAINLMKVDEAIFLHNICYWVEINKKNNNNYYNGEYWTYNSDRAFSELFQFFSPAQIKRMRKNLINAGYIKTGCFNRFNPDKTTWYTYTEKVTYIAEDGYINGILRREDPIYNSIDDDYL